MDTELAAITDFVRSNRKALAGYLRQKLAAAGAKAYLDQLGKAGIDRLESEAAGVLLDLACALLCRLHPDRDRHTRAVSEPRRDQALRRQPRLARCTR